VLESVEKETYLLLDVIEGIRRVDREADEDNMRVGVGERPQSIVILLSGGIPKSELDLLSIDLDICGRGEGCGGMPRECRKGGRGRGGEGKEKRRQSSRLARNAAKSKTLLTGNVVLEHSRNVDLEGREEGEGRKVSARGRGKQVKERGDGRRGEVCSGEGGVVDLASMETKVSKLKQALSREWGERKEDQGKREGAKGGKEERAFRSRVRSRATTLTHPPVVLGLAPKPFRRHSNTS